MVDVSSKGMALLYYADENCPQPDQFITTNFGVPYFDSDDSFDTVFFNSIGRVCRVDSLTSKVNRIAIQFAEPLFFKPGEQEISESDLQNRLEAQALSIVKTEEKVKVYDEALTRAEEQIRFYAETNVKAQAFAKSETQARVKAEARAKSEAKLRAKAEKQAKTEAERRAKIEAQAQKKDKLYTEEIARLKDEKARAIAQVKAETAETIEKIEQELRTMGIDKINISDKQPIRDVVLEKVDKFVKDRNKIF